jgi:hypothetical protein
MRLAQRRNERFAHHWKMPGLGAVAAMALP